MLMVVLAALVSIALLAVAMGVIAAEFHAHGVRIADALAFREPGDVRLQPARATSTPRAA